ncbi:MAG: class E sortase [Chloroflexi bacterium]|nr:MAG: class E sortase [Chloroflexota bacterium]
MSSTRAPAAAPPLPRRGRRLGPFRLLGVLVGLGLVAGGLVLIVPPLWALYQRNKVDDNALSQWNKGGSQALVGGGATNYTGQCGSGDPSENYARVSFPSLPQYGYAGVAGDGSWDLLKQRSMVHYKGTAAPGQTGNDIIAFHREPEYEHIDQLKVGDVVDVQDRSCKTYAYRITGRWQLYPSNVTQLTTTTGSDLTLITCTPFWVDSQRLVWRGALITAPGAQ